MVVDQEKLALLKQGSEAWNAWRKQQPEDVLIDLSEVYLRGIQLPGADLHNVNLRHAIIITDDNGSPLLPNFCEANLSGADLRWADMETPDMRSACLNAADLREAKLNQPDLRQAHHAKLSERLS